MKDTDIALKKFRYFMLEFIPRTYKQLMPKNDMFGDTITVSQIKILMLFDRCLIYKMTEISTLLSISPASVTRSVNKLLKEGYFQRRSDNKDRRVVVVELTAKGKTLLAWIVKYYENKIAELLSGRSEKEKENFCGLINGAVMLSECAEHMMNNQILTHDKSSQISEK
ncbi:MAG: hypothetical protein A2452_10980 [Candidatus Firestonebacteria bacterium RIFOXYC2_FULL_39_67]|nr:MAG: hypothetical protein A2536_08880 [Candidatus Firestonebacteria bacterium RIFOXYD2_FULL_39_29]OGF55978.1 MAG: hypothetical protein A2452_10980 [Candidatus Firestonebacteria bacterium RIFOXYC2_FULL_39_67]